MIIAVDPGKNTGIATFDRVEGTVKATQDLDQQMTCDMVYELMMVSHVELVVCESFTVTGSKVVTFQPYSLEIIGMLRWLCERNDVPFVEQTPRDAKTFATDDRLRKMGWYLPGKKHANDAQRHLFLYAVRQGWINPVEVDARAS